MNEVGQIEVLTVLYKINVFLIDNGKSSCHNRALLAIGDKFNAGKSDKVGLRGSTSSLP